jgi:DNA-binding FadR family transcriptional regulator
MLTRARTQAWSSDELPHRWTDHHEAVYEAIRDGDPKRARSSCLAHLASVVDNLAAATADDQELEHRMRKLMADVGIVDRAISEHQDEGDDENVRDV